MGPLGARAIARMREPQVETDEPGRSMALTWFVRELDGIRLAEHGGGTNGQQSFFSIAPEAGFALAIVTNHRVFVPEGTFEGARGDFVRDGEGRIAWFRSGGRLHAAPRDRN